MTKKSQSAPKFTKPPNDGRTEATRTPRQQIVARNALEAEGEGTDSEPTGPEEAGTAPAETRVAPLAAPLLPPPPPPTLNPKP